MFTDVTGRATTYFFSTKKYGCLHALVYNLQFPCSSPEFLSFFFKENNAFRKSSAVRDHCVLVFVLCCRCTNVFMGSHFKCSARFHCQSFHLHSLETLKYLSFSVLIKQASCVIKKAHMFEDKTTVR